MDPSYFDLGTPNKLPFILSKAIGVLRRTVGEVAFAGMPVIADKKKLDFNGVHGLHAGLQQNTSKQKVEIA